MAGPPRPGNYQQMGGMSRMPPPPSSTQNTPFMNGPSSLPPNSSGQFNNSFSSPVGGPPKSNTGPPPMMGGQGQNLNLGVQKPSGTPTMGGPPLGGLGPSVPSRQMSGPPPMNRGSPIQGGVAPNSAPQTPSNLSVPGKGLYFHLDFFDKFGIHCIISMDFYALF